MITPETLQKAIQRAIDEAVKDEIEASADHIIRQLHRKIGAIGVGILTRFDMEQQGDRITISFNFGDLKKEKIG